MELIAELKFYGFALSAALQFSLLTLVKRNRRLERLERAFFALIACFFVWNFSNFLLLLFKKTANPLSEFLLDLVVAPLAFCIFALTSFASAPFSSPSSRTRFVRTHRQGHEILGDDSLCATPVLALCPLGFCSFLYPAVFGTGRFYLCTALCGLVLYRVDCLDVVLN